MTQFQIFPDLKAIIVETDDPRALTSIPSFDGRSCVTCGDPIPEGRLKLGKAHCVDCQERLDMTHRMMRRR